ncbi:MAG: hypothetical protein U0X91_08745 [Spirosomataceae bacterium]
MHPLFIDIEGLHGVGKSEVVIGVANAIGAEYLPTIPAELEGARNFFNQVDDVNARYLFFYAAVMHSTKQIRQTLLAGKSVVVESYIYRTIAFHKGMGATVDITMPCDLPQPDLTFHLKCSASERAIRLMKRSSGTLRKGMYETLAESNVQRILDEYKKFEMIEVDTTDKNPFEVIRDIKNTIEYEPIFKKLLG